VTIKICLSLRKVIVADESHIAGNARALSGIVRLVQSGRQPGWQQDIQRARKVEVICRYAAIHAAGVWELRPSPSFELASDLRNSTPKRSSAIRSAGRDRRIEEVRDNPHSSTSIGGAQHVETAFAHLVFPAYADQRAQNEKHEEEDPHQFGDGEEVHQRLNSEQVDVNGIGGCGGGRQLGWTPAQSSQQHRERPYRLHRRPLHGVQ